MFDVRTDMRGWTLIIVALIAAAVAGCKGNATCEKFVEAMTDEERSQTKGLLVGMCENAMNDSTFGSRDDKEKSMMKEMNASIRKKAACVVAANTCGDAKKCDASGAE